MTNTDVTEEQYKKWRMLKLEGRACAGPSRSRLGCMTRAVVEQGIESWQPGRSEGPCKDTWAPKCRRHARLTPVGYVGVNFRVSSEREFIDP